MDGSLPVCGWAAQPTPAGNGDPGSFCGFRVGSSYCWIQKFLSCQLQETKWVFWERITTRSEDSTYQRHLAAVKGKILIQTKLFLLVPDLEGTHARHECISCFFQPIQWTSIGMQVSVQATPTPWEIPSGRTTIFVLWRSWDPMESSVRRVHILPVLGIH